MRSGGGLRFSIRIDRGMEIAEAEYLGIPYGWQTGVGPAHPSFYQPGGDGWLGLYDGGLMTMGGLDQIGEPCQDQGTAFDLHGRLAVTPAVETGYQVDWQAGKIRVWGTIRQLMPTKTFLELRREVEVPIGGTRINVTDRVTNRGYQPVAHMILYHLNLGYPLLDVGSLFVAPSKEVKGWDELSEAHLTAGRIVPEMNGEEYVFGHRTLARGAWTTAALINRGLGEGSFLALRYRQDTLPNLWQWVSLRPGSWVMGIEPANSDIRGRSYAREHSVLPELRPGQEVTYRVQLRFGSGPKAIGQILRQARIE